MKTIVRFVLPTLVLVALASATVAPKPVATTQAAIAGDGTSPVPLCPGCR